MTTGVLVMSYGTPRDRGDIEAYYTDIRRGHPPPPDLLADLVRRYDTVLARTVGAAGDDGFPLRRLTDRQVSAVGAALGPGFVVAQGTKHSTPSIADGVGTLADAGVDRIVGVVLAPHHSPAITDYAARARSAAEAHGLPLDMLDEWHLLPAYVEFLAGAVTAARDEVPAGSEVVFTAHSLPVRVAGETYGRQLQETAAAVAAAAGVASWSVGWQSAGRTADTWLGPDVLEIVRDRAASRAAGLVVCACGFVADHLEVAYDLDVDAAALASELGLPFARTASVNDDPAVMSALAAAVAAV